MYYSAQTFVYLMRLIITIIFLFFSLLSFSQKLSSIQKKVISNDLAYYIKTDTANFTYHMGPMMFVSIGLDTFYNPEGFHLLYKLKDNKAYRLDRSSYHGHNFGRLLFAHNNKIFLMGGYGFFTTNNLLEYFDLQLKEWNFIATLGDRPPYINGLLFKQDSIIYLMNSFRSGNYAEADKLDPYLYLYNINSNYWKKYKNNNAFGSTIFRRNFNLKNYSISISDEKTLIINKANLHYTFISNSELPVSDKYSNFIEVQGDTLYYTHLGSLESNRNRILMNVDSLFKANDDQSQQIILAGYSFLHRSPYSFLMWLLLALAFILITFMVLKRIKNKEKSSQDLTKAVNDPLLSKLLNTKDAYITVEELDELLEIDHMEIESKKSKRHRIITQLNEEYPGIIIRKKDEEDKRRFLYLIDKKVFIKM